MKSDWLPVSAALLLTGVLALALGSILIPSSDGVGETVRVVQEQGGVWMAAATIYFLSAVCLTLGLPSVLTLVQRRGRTLGLISAVVLEFGFVGTAGYAMLMVFFRALVDTGTLVNRGINQVVTDSGLQVFLYGWIVGFVLGELLLAAALLRARTVPRWIPLLLVLHVATVPISSLLPDVVAKMAVLLLVAGLGGVAVHANTPQHGVRRT